MRNLIGLFCLSLLFCLTNCTLEGIAGRYVLSVEEPYYDTPVLPLPQFLTLNIDGSFNSSLPLEGRYLVEKNRCKLITLDKSASVQLIITRNIFGRVKMSYGEIYYLKVK